MLFSSLFKVNSETDERFWGGNDFAPITAAGVRVTEETAMRHGAVYASVRLLSETLASLPLSVFRKLPDGTREPLPDHWLYNLLHHQPNGFQSSFEFREMMMGHITLRGNCYALKDINSAGEISSLTPFHPSQVKPEWTDRHTIIYKVRDPVTNTETVYTDEEIFHVKGLSSDGLLGLNPIHHHRETIAVGMAAQEYANRFFSNDATPSSVLEHPSTFKDDEAYERFRKSWQESQTGVNRHKTAVLEDGMKLTAIGMTNEDAQFLETKKLNITDIARIFNIPPHMIGDLEKATFSNISDQSIQFVVHTMRPWLVRWEQAFKRDMIVEPDVYVEFNVDGLLRGDPTTRAAYYSSGIQSGWLTPNEVRQRENMNPLKGLDEPMLPLNMAPPNDRANELEEAAADRIVRKESKLLKTDKETLIKSLGTHVAFIASVMQVSVETAHLAIDDLLLMFDEEILIEDFAAIRTERLLKIVRSENV